ncbi:beta-lactamase family protein [Aspergillus karnatakaensis]|uniref:serine hydrolase domain-containing protein n=1 Tax=Aspergillus karnatakaensis TaxID=1810916 RepID=UPI003CCDD656
MPPTTLSATDRQTLQRIADSYTADPKRTIPGLVYGAIRNDGEPFFEYASGTVGISCSKKMTLDTVFWVASFTKLLTSVACMQLVEQGRLKLDDAEQVESIAPELAAVKVLRRRSDGEFELVDKQRRITLRMLLTHTAGFGYAFEDSNLAEYGRPIGFDDFSGSREDMMTKPLVNQPGEKFQYGTSMDWVGLIIERVAGLALEEYFSRNILTPLGMEVSFYPLKLVKGSNLAYLHRRADDGSLMHIDHLYQTPLTWKVEVGKQMFCAGGHGCFGKPTHFLRLISVLLNDGTDAKSGTQLLKPETVDEMFKDQIPNQPRYSNESVPVAKPHLANPTPLIPMPEDHTEGWGLSFSINHFPERSGRAAGSGSWEGLANLFWFADRTSKIGGVIASQILPYGDKYVLECSERLETEIYRIISRK